MVLPKKLFLKSSKIKQACVSGASGFVGTKLVERLISQGFSVRVLTRNSKRSFPEGVKVFYADLASSKCNLRNFFSGCDIFFHCAGDIKNLEHMHALHVDGTKKIIDALNKSNKIDEKPKHFIQLSSIGVYGNAVKRKQTRVVTEESAYNPLGEYEITKALSDQIIINSIKNTNLTYTILRPSNVVGFLMPNQSFISLLRAIRCRQFFFIGSRKSISNYIHVDDVVDALMVCAKNKKAKNQVFNLSKDCNLFDIVSMVSSSFGIKENFICLPELPLRFGIYWLSKIYRLPLTNERIDALISKTKYPATKIKDVLGFSPSRSIPEFAIEYLKSFDA
jgi:nucleoside-diphosphate-sugar epimerase